MNQTKIICQDKQMDIRNNFFSSYCLYILSKYNRDWVKRPAVS